MVSEIEFEEECTCPKCGNVFMVRGVAEIEPPF